MSDIWRGGEEVRAFERSLRQLNGSNLTLEDGYLVAESGVLLLPYTYHEGRPISEADLEWAKTRDARYVEASLGFHNYEERLVVLHQDFVTSPAKEVGHYRVALHEVGHALDHALERRDGSAHRERVGHLYEQAKKRESFLTERASHNVREYFAEAVEAFLTQPLDEPEDEFKKANHREALRQSDPGMFAYLHHLFCGSPSSSRRA